MAKHSRLWSRRGETPGDAPARTITNKQKAIAIGLSVVVLAGIAIGVVAATSGGKKAPSHANNGKAKSTVVKLASNLCPLTGMPAPGGVVPARPALMVKIGNEPFTEARPQSGLNEADIVYDTPAEGFVMRYVAVYQCNNASSIGPTRSVRWVDYHMIARPFYNPIIAFAGGIIPNTDGVARDSSWLSGVNLLDVSSSVAWRITTRSAPDNLFTSTAALYGHFPKLKTPPPPQFSYSAKPVSAATPAASLAINFSYGTDVVWNWDAQKGLWMHTYAGKPVVSDVDVLNNQQVSTTNIVVQVVKYSIGPHIESTGGSGDIQSQMLGSGTGYILRNGTSVKVTWHRTDEIDPTTFTDAAGQKVSLAPGRTWVEIVPNVQAKAAGGIVITK